MKLSQILNESINDKGLFKAIFLAGPPAAGKSTLIKAIYRGDIGPRVVDPDKIATIISKNQGIDHSDVYKGQRGREFHEMKTRQVAQYINGMLPMFIDATNREVTRTIERVNILQSFGYDTMMIWLGTDIFKVLDNMKERERQVPQDFINDSFEQLEANFLSYQQFFGPDFYVHENYFMTKSEQEEFYRLKSREAREPLTGIAASQYEYLKDRFEEAAKTLVSLEDVKAATDKFLTSPLKNRYGKQSIEYLTIHNRKYLLDGIFTPEKMAAILANW